MDRGPRQPDDRLAGSGAPRQPASGSQNPDHSGDIEREGDAVVDGTGVDSATPGSDSRSAIPPDEL